MYVLKSYLFVLISSLSSSLNDFVTYITLLIIYQLYMYKNFNLLKSIPTLRYLNYFNSCGDSYNKIFYVKSYQNPQKDLTANRSTFHYL